METDHVAAEDGISELWAATSLENLHRLLGMRRVSDRSTQHQEAVELFVRHHGEDPRGGVDTALLRGGELLLGAGWRLCSIRLTSEPA